MEFVGKKQKQLKPEDGDVTGDQYVFITLAGTAKAIICYRVGKRTAPTTRALIYELRERVLGAPELSSDASRAYPMAIAWHSASTAPSGPSTNTTAPRKR